MSCLIVILLSLQFVLFAQTQSDYITPIDIQSVNLDEIQLTHFERLEKNPEYRSIQFVEIGKLQDFINNSELTFNIPGEEERYVALVKEFEFSSPDDYIWKGDLIDQYGSIVIFCEKGKVFGHIVIENQEYDIQIFDEKNLFIAYNTEYISSLNCGAMDIPEKINQPGNNTIDTMSGNSRSCTGLVRILVLYTSAAQNAVSNISTTATLAINTVTDALNNSDVSWGDLHVSKAGLVFYNFTESNDMEQDLLSVRKKTLLF